MLNINGRTILDDLLLRIGQKLQLNETRREKAKKSYETINEILKDDYSVTQGCNANIYAQGSYAIGTTVKPIKDGEFDLDFVFKIEKLWDESMNVNTILENIKAAIEKNDTYKGKVELKNRCVRVNYADDFHLDILPAYPIGNLDSEYLKIPDRKLNKWVDTSPRLYAGWFNKIANDFEHIKLFEQNTIEDLPEDESYGSKPPLKIAVQLLKRYKNLYFADDEENETPSIIITTLAANSYLKTSSEIQTIRDFLTYVNVQMRLNGGNLVVENPHNTNEKFTDKWKDKTKMYAEFKNYMKSLSLKIAELDNPKNLNQVNELLYELFGEKVVSEALFEQANFIRERNNPSSSNHTKILSTAVGVTGLNSTQVIAKNTFYGG